MKKLYFLALLCCLGISAYSQVTTVIWCTNAPFKSGWATSASRTDITLQTTAATQRGWAVFDLSSIPAGAVINDVRIGVWCSFYGGAGVPSGWSTNGYAGDLSTITLPATLFPAMVPTVSAVLTTETYGTTTGSNVVLMSTPASTAFVSANAGSNVSIAFTGGASRTYNFVGRTGIATGDADTSTPNHAPFIKITYCPPPASVTASAGPNPVCENETLTLTGAGGAGATSYLWEGPGGYTSTSLSPSFTPGPTAAGVYTLTAINSCGTFSATAVATTAAVTVNAAPAAITGASGVCEGLATSLTSAPTTGNWTSSDPSVASVGLSTGVVTGVLAGTATITYTLSSGCFETYAMTVNATPDPISGATEVCENASVTLTDGVGGGTWTTSSPDITVGASSGIVTGVAAGTASVTYTTGGCPSVSYDMTINPAPAPIGGPNEVCVGETITVTETSTGGTWSSGSITIAMVGTSGIVTGVSGGTVNIIYTFSSTTGCQAFKSVTVHALPAAISGPSSVCIGENITLTDATPSGNFSSGSGLVSVLPGGTVTGIAAGVADITYTITTTGCRVTTPVTVQSLPAAITGTAEVCEGESIILSDADPGGSWSSGATAVATVGTPSGTVNGVLAGTAPISYTLSTGCSAVIDVTVNPAPIAVITPAGPTTFCAGLDVVLDATPGGVTYQWDDGTGPIAGATTASYTAAISGSYTVDISNSFGCHTTSPAIVVTAGINAVINYSTALNFCIGGSINLTADAGSAVGAISYQWQKDGVDIPGATFITHTATASGVYTCRVTVAGGSGVCTVTTPPVTVAVNNMPTPTIAHTGTSLVSTSSYAKYQWFINSSAITGATNMSYVPYANGIYRVRVSDAIGCSGYSNAIQITGVGVAQLNKDNVAVYPNPVKDILNIESPMPLHAVVTGIEGKVVVDEKRVQKIDLGKLAAGMYILKLYDDEGEMIIVQKLIKE